MTTLSPELAQLLQKGVVIPAHPLALTPQRGLDVRCQRALTRYYCAAGAEDVALGCIPPSSKSTTRKSVC